MPSAPIYLDNAASTRIADPVLALMTEVMRTAWGNPTALHPQGVAARGYLEAARQRLVAALGDGDIVWTSGCTEANALAVLGAARTHAGKIVVSTFEHAAVATLADRLGSEGREVVRVAPAATGVLDAETFARAAEGAGVVSLIAVQNEIGLVQPLAELVAAIRARAPHAHIHVDAAQAFGKIALSASALVPASRGEPGPLHYGVDSIAIAGHKLHGPKGVGALWLRTGATIQPLWVGGGQQHGLRGGTQDAPGAAGMGLAAERAIAALPVSRARWLEHAAYVVAGLEQRGVAVRQLVPDQRRSPHILALGIPGVPASALRSVLASRGVYVSTGSSCSDGAGKSSAVLVALGLPPDVGMVRLSFGHDTTDDEIASATTTLADVALELRA